MVRIQIETGYLDVKEGTNLPLNFQVGDIRDLTQRKGTFSKTITLSGTKNNNLLLNNYYDVNVSEGTFSINTLTKCSILQNGIPIVTDALLQLVNVKKVQLTDAYEQGVEYEVLIRDSQAEFYTAITNLELTDLDFSDCDHEFSITAITDSWSHTQSDHYKYLMPYNDTPNYTVNHFKPAIYAKSYFDRIFANSGFTYNWTNLSDFHFDKLLIPYNGDVNNFDYTDYRVTAETTFLSSYVQPNPGLNQSFTQQITTWTETLDVQSLFNPTLGEYTAPFNTDTAQGQTYTFSFVYAYEIILDNASTSPPATAYLKVQDPSTLLYQNAEIEYILQFELLVNGSGVGFVQAIDVAHVGDGVTSYSIPVGTTSVLSASGTTTIPIPINITATDIVEIQAGLYVNSLYNNTIEAVWRDTNATSGGSNVQVNPQVDFSSLKVDIVPSNNIQIITGVQVVNQFIPLKIKQSDFVKAIFQMYNLYAYPNTNQPNELILVHRDEWYDSGAEKDWSTKLAKNQEQELIFLPDLSKKKLKLTYKPDTDSPNVVYTQATAETYGQLEYTFDNEYVKDTDTKELLFSPTPVSKTAFDAYLPMINGIAPNTNIRILYDVGLTTCQPFNIYEQGTTGTTGLTSYPQTGHFNDALTPTFDINFGVCDYYFYQTAVLTNNNLYNLYWRRTVNQINVGKMLIASFHLNEADIQTLKLNDKIRIDNSWWNINKVIDYNANDEVLTKVELISIDTEIELANFPITNPRPIGDILTASGISEINDQIKKQSNVNLSEGNFQIYGKGNVVPSGLKGIVVGDNQNVTEDGITTSNLTITETINGQSVNTMLPIYKKYVALISQTGINPPTATILENTIGDIVFNYNGIGDYDMVLAGAFLANKTWVVGGSADINAGGGDFATLDIRRANDNTIILRTYDNFTAADDMLVNTSIEIRIYP
jgi:hypothetical protein